MKTVFSYVAVVLALAVSVGLAWVFNFQPAPRHQYAVDFANGGPLGIAIVITVPCSQKPGNWKDVAAYCDRSAAQAHVVSQETYDALNQGDEYKE